MRTTTLKISKVKVRGDSYLCVTYPKPGRGRNRRFFKATPEGREEAETFLKLKKVERLNYGAAGIALTEVERAEYIKNRDLLRPFGVTISDMVERWLPELRARNRSCTAEQLKEEMIKAKEADGASAAYVKDLKTRLKRFATDFDGQLVATITQTQVDDWLRSLPVAGVSRNNYRRVVVVVFNYAVEKGYCASNPAEKTAKAKEIETAAGILTVEQTRNLLENAPSEMVAFLSIGAFAGMRRAELERLDWAEVDLVSGVIEVTAKKAKSSKRRLINIRENLADWLRDHKKESGPVAPANYEWLLEVARKNAGIAHWPNNALRHGFASYDLAHRNDAAALALEMGHGSTKMIFAHYRNLVRPADAKRYWEIRPAKVANVVSMTA